MGGLRAVYRTAKWLLMLYGLWQAVLRSRWLTLAIALWRMLGGKPRRDAGRVAVITFADAGEPAVYRRLGWRSIRSRRMSGAR
ncbi:hypothetical protein [Alicyclobacillus macrosporangiidus]|uniref:hypothetical protein n=1 Tax=Alicyclobacillus macrosporangiidus TaxID=392015 RepID=UPI0004951318|nr:hypothetical protein [Alicyclobacillus macrosporangiidus]